MDGPANQPAAGPYRELGAPSGFRRLKARYVVAMVVVIAVLLVNWRLMNTIDSTRPSVRPSIANSVDNGNESDLHGKLVMSIMVARHGDRAPQRSAPAYATGDRAHYDRRFKADVGGWDVDYGQLSGLGMKQCYNLGAFLRERYVLGEKKNRLLKSSYDHMDTHARATDVDRTLVSAMAILDGLYPKGTGPPGGKDWRPEFIPVHTIAYATDALLDGSANTHCPIFKKHATAAYKGKFITDAIYNSPLMTKGFQDLSGMTSKAIRALKAKKLVKLATHLRDLRVCQRAHNITIDKSLTQYDDDLEDITKRVVVALWGSSGLGRLGGARIVRSFANRIEVVRDALEGQKQALDIWHEECNSKGQDSDEQGACPRKFLLYLGHDTTIFGLRASLGMPPAVQGVAPYTSHVILELRQRDPKDHSVGSFTVNVLTGSVSKKTALEGGSFCRGKSSCPLETFLDYIEHEIPEDVDLACGYSPPAASSSGFGHASPQAFFIAGLCCIVLVGLALLLGACLVG